MALIGKYTKYETVETGETEIQTVEYPLSLLETDPTFEKAGTTEEVESPIYEHTQKVYKNAYVTVNSITSWKFQTNEGSDTLVNINYRVYKSKKDRTNDLNSFIHDDHLVSQKIDYTSGKNEIQQAYELVKTTLGCEELIND